MAVTSSEVAAYSGLVNSLAWKYVGFSGAEYDDLYQEGMLAVFLSLKAGKNVSKLFVEYRLRNWCRFLLKLINNDGIAYEVMCPMEYHDASAV